MKDRQDLPIIVGGWACLIVWAALLGGCGALAVGYGPDGKANSLVLKVADAAPSPEEAKTAGEAVGDTVKQVDDSVGAILESSTVQTLLTLGIGGPIVAGTGIFAGHRSRKAEEAKQKAIRDEHNRTWEESQLDLLRKLQMQSTQPILPTETSA